MKRRRASIIYTKKDRRRGWPVLVVNISFNITQEVVLRKDHNEYRERFITMTTTIYSTILLAVCQTLKQKYDPDIEPPLIKNVYMPRLIRYLPLTEGAKLAGAELLDRLNLKTGQCNISRSEAAGFLKTAKSTFSEAIKELADNNILFIKRAPRCSGPKTKQSPEGGGPPKETNQYDFNWELLLDPTLWSQKHGAYENHTYEIKRREKRPKKSGPENRPDRSEKQTYGSEKQTCTGRKNRPDRSEKQTLTRQETRESDKRSKTRHRTSEAVKNEDSSLASARDSASPGAVELDSNLVSKSPQGSTNGHKRPVADNPTGPESHAPIDAANTDAFPTGKGETPEVDLELIELALANGRYGRH
jgi:hypothetical protein